MVELFTVNTLQIGLNFFKIESDCLKEYSLSLFKKITGGLNCSNQLSRVCVTHISLKTF